MFQERCDGIENCLERAVLNNSPGDIISLANEGGDVDGLTQSGESLIHLAARLGNSSSIAALGFLKANLEALNSSNATPLDEAVKNNCVPSVKALLAAGAEVEKYFIRGDTYLHIAAAGSHNGALEVLLEEDMDVNKKNHLDETPLLQAVRAGNVQGVEMLLEKKAESEIFAKDGKSLLEMAVESQNVEIFKLLVKAGTNLKTNDGNTVFHLVARFGNARMLDVIKKVTLPANFRDKDGFTPLHVASNPSVIKNLIKMGLNVNERSGKGETALHLASAKGSLALVRTLCQAGAAVDAQDDDGTSALMITLRNSKEDISTFLLHNGADPQLKDKEGRTALHYAVEGGCARSVTNLLIAGASMDEQDNKGNTPIFAASLNNKPAVLQMLVENGADLTQKDRDGNGILHTEASTGHVEAVKKLIDAGAIVDMKGKDQWTALHCAAEKGHFTVVRELLERGADPAAKNGDDWTPLMLASSGGYFNVVQLLVNHGAPLNDKAGFFRRTALYWANEHKHRAVAEYLKYKGAVE